MYTLFITSINGGWIEYGSNDFIGWLTAVADTYYPRWRCEVRDSDGLIVKHRTATSSWQ